ncbi:hypothetical protein YC2023_022070 [Brassica napus]
MEEMMMKTSDNAILDNLSSQSVHIEKLHEDNQREEDVVVPEYPKEDHNEMVQRLQEVAKEHVTFTNRCKSKAETKTKCDFRDVRIWAYSIGPFRLSSRRVFTDKGLTKLCFVQILLTTRSWLSGQKKASGKLAMPSLSSSWPFAILATKLKQTK